MSQNAHTLLLLFDNSDIYKDCYRMLKHLEASSKGKSAVYGKKIGVDITETWENDWFNQSITATPQFLRINYDTSTGYNLPLDALQQLFAAGLKAACLEVFYDQVGEYGQYYFLQDQMVDKETLCNKYPKITKIITQQFEVEDSEDDGINRPTPISTLIKDEKKDEENSKQMVDAMLGLAKASKESGENPLAVLKGAMMLRAAGKGLLQAIIFAVITILLFKGLWLWISLSVILAVILPVLYVAGVNAEFEDEGEEE